MEEKISEKNIHVQFSFASSFCCWWITLSESLCLLINAIKVIMKSMLVGYWYLFKENEPMFIFLNGNLYSHHISSVFSLHNIVVFWSCFHPNALFLLQSPCSSVILTFQIALFHYHTYAVLLYSLNQTYLYI